jgi:hypothetical protein
MSAMSMNMSRDSGAGVLLGLAAGDQGSGAAYGHHGQVAMVVAYELLRYGSVEQVRIREALARLTGGRSGRSRVRGAPPWLDGYLQMEKDRALGTGPHGGTNVATRAVSIGVWHRNQPAELVADAVRASNATHSDRRSAVAAAVLAGTIAGIAHGQHGRDLVVGAWEVGHMAADRVGNDDSFDGDASSLLDSLESAFSLVGRDPLATIEHLQPERETLMSVMAGIVIGAPLRQDPFSVIPEIAPLRRRDVDIVVSAMVGAKAGLVQWPSSVANDTWFAEIGRRLADRRPFVDDLPDLFEVEDRLSHGPPGGLG